MRKYRRSTWFFFGALFLVAIVAVLPQSGWLIRTELGVIGGKGIPGNDAVYPRGAAPDSMPRIRAVAATKPDDYALQLAAALQNDISNPSESKDGTDTHASTLQALLLLRDRFGDQPSLHAYILRYLCSERLRIGRTEENILWRPRKDSQPVLAADKHEPPTAETIALAEAEASRGEALDPQNAYFPAMRAIALLAAHQDTAAIAELEQAGRAPHWNDYTADEIHARWTMSEAAYGKTGALNEIEIGAAVLFPEYAKLRDLARMSIALAVLWEQAGDPEGGFAIRHSIARLGSAMRVDATTIIGSLVGDAITAIASSRPGGAPVLDDSLKGDVRTAANDARYVTYLAKIGHPEEGDWFLAERRAQDKSRAIFRHAQDLSLFGMKPLLWLAGWWGGGIVLLVNTLWILLLGGVAALLSRTPRIRTEQTLHKGILWGLRLTFLLIAEAVVFTFCVSTPSASDSAAYLMMAAGAGMILIPFAFLKRGENWRGFGRNVGACLGTVVAIGVLSGLAAWSLGCYTEISRQSGVLTGLSSDSNNGTNIGAVAASSIIVTGFALAVPLITTIVLAIRSRKHRIPASVGVVRGLTAGALPIAGMLLLLYAAVAGATLIQEQNVSNQENQSVAHEGKYYASLLGQEWPGPISQSSSQE